MASSEGDELELQPPKAKKPKLAASPRPVDVQTKLQSSLSSRSQNASACSAAHSYSTDSLRKFHKPKLGLNVDYYPRFFSKATADGFLRQLETQLRSYYESSRNEVTVFGKVHKIPRKQTAFGDHGLSYNFSGTSVPANDWIPVISEIKSCVEDALGETFNFVLVNRYGDGNDHMGEHRDDETDLITGAPIASVTFGRARDFVFKHKDARGKNATRKDISPVTVCLEHGSLLIMKHPTNSEWYHSLPVRKKVSGVRVNLTFRQMRVKR